MSSTTLTVLPSGTEIHCLGASVQIDVDSWGWRFEAQLLRASEFALVDPTTSGPVEALLTINGYQWAVIIERYSYSEKFPRKGYTISGRSKSAYLTGDYVAPVSYIEDSVRTANQLAEAELLNTGWALNWGVPDWSIPAGVWSYTEKAPIAAIQEIAASVGAVLYTHPTDQTLFVKSRYPVSPWNWDTAIPNKSFGASVSRAPSGKYEPGPFRNGVYVAGMEDGGILASIKRTGTDGALALPMVTHKLITHIDAGRERGRVELGKSGKRDYHEIPTVLLPPEEADGLILPCEIVGHTDSSGASWKGQVMGVRIIASGINVTQALTIERYRDQ